MASAALCVVALLSRPGLATGTSRSAVLAHDGLLHLRGGGLDLESMLAAAKDPEALAELQELMNDPEALAEVRELMDDPAFRAQVQDALAAGGGGSLKELQDQLAANKDGGLGEGLKALGPSLGAALDLLKAEVTADEFGTACVALTNIVKRRLKLGADQIGANGPRLRVNNEKLVEALLKHAAGKRCLAALGFTEEVGDADGEGDEAAFLEVGEAMNLDERQLKRALGVIDEALVDSSTALEISSAHGLPYKLALELPAMRRACEGDQALGTAVTQLLMEHQEFRLTVCTPEAADLAMPSIGPLLRSKDGLQALLEFYTGAGPPNGTRVTSVETVSEYKDALYAAGDEKLVVVFFANSAHLGCRVLSPMVLRLPEANDSEFKDVVFVRVMVDAKTDDGLAQAIFAEAGIPETDVPTFAFFAGCLELKKWRLSASTDAGELLKRIRRIAPDPADPTLDDGPDAPE